MATSQVQQDEYWHNGSAADSGVADQPARADGLEDRTIPEPDGNATARRQTSDRSLGRGRKPFAKLMRAIAPGLCLLGVLCVKPEVGKAQEVYVARDVDVEAQAESPAAARAAALAQGRLEGLRQVLSNLTGGGAQGTPPDPSPADADRLALDYSVADEKTTSTAYIARMTIRYDAAGVQQLLSSVGMTATSSQRNAPIAVLPVYRLGPSDDAMLWEDPNPWRDSWQRVSDANEGMVPVVVPMGDLADLASVDANTALSGDLASVAANLSQRYGATGAVAIQAVGDPSRSLNINFRGVEPPFEALGSFTVSVRVGEDANELMSRAVAEARNILEEAWVRASGGTVGASEMTVLATFTGLGEWVDMQRRLGAVPQISQVNVQAVTRGRAQIQLLYRGDLNTLAQALVGQGIAVNQFGAVWTLSAMGGLPGGVVPSLGGSVSTGQPTPAPAPLSPGQVAPGWSSGGAVQPEPGVTRFGTGGTIPPSNGPGTLGGPVQ